MSRNQKTIKKEIKIEGVGIHTGESSILEICPSEANSGIVFVRTDIDGNPEIPVIPENVKFDSRRTSIAVGEAEVHTVEHFLAAMCGLGIDNLRVRLSGPEIPAGDGSAYWFLNELKKAGIKELDNIRPTLTLKEPIAIHEGDASIMAIPSDGSTHFSYTLDYTKYGLPPQFVTYTFSNDTFEEEISKARTFCFKPEVDKLRNEEGLGKGANYQNTLVLENNKPIENKYRYPDEPARHKMLDLIGDLYILGADVNAHIVAVKSGHRLNNKFANLLKKALSNQESQVLGFDIRQIQKILPHRYPFLLVDRIVEFEEGKRIVGYKNVTFNEEFFQGHFPGQPVMPGVLQVEAMAQVGGLLMLKQLNESGRIAYLSSIDNIKFRKPVVPGDQLRMEVLAKKMRRRFGQVQAKGTVNGQVVCEGEIKFALVDIEEDI